MRFLGVSDSRKKSCIRSNITLTSWSILWKGTSGRCPCKSLRGFFTLKHTSYQRLVSEATKVNEDVLYRSEPDWLGADTDRNLSGSALPSGLLNIFPRKVRGNPHPWYFGRCLVNLKLEVKERGKNNRIVGLIGKFDQDGWSLSWDLHEQSLKR